MYYWDIIHIVEDVPLLKHGKLPEAIYIITYENLMNTRQIRYIQTTANARLDKLSYSGQYFDLLAVCSLREYLFLQQNMLTENFQEQFRSYVSTFDYWLFTSFLLSIFFHKMKAWHTRMNPSLQSSCDLGIACAMYDFIWTGLIHELLSTTFIYTLVHLHINVKWV